ncbi:Uncharacterised protein [Streptococcus equinus]|uniref:hypothetical protein n=1 Tax=Streptococcus equinus TaxID=1335 RepID=UPI000F70FA06|nr:hypothetical protein [Streptococcus equinus]VEE22338.1 Uncharacterised protein [Streptococcus equinus]
MRRDKETTRTTKEEVKRIVDKYNESFSELSNNGTAKALKTVMKYIADQANKRQRQLVGLKEVDDEERED